MMFFSSASALHRTVLLPLAEELCWFSIMVSEGDYRIMDSSKKPSSFGPTVAMMSKVTLGIEIANSFPLGIHDGRAAACLSIEQRRDYSVSPVCC